mgnify:CR=1 FL=1
MNTAVVKTQLGRTILVQLDETSPRPYSRANLIQGTEGTLAGFPTRVAGEKLGNGNYHEWIEGNEKLAPIFEKYEHPLWKRVGPLALKMGGHGGMDYILQWRIVQQMRTGQVREQLKMKVSAVTLEPTLFLEINAAALALSSEELLERVRNVLLSRMIKRMREVNRIAAAQGLPAVQSLSASQVGGSNKPGGGLDLELAPM